ncbi:MAG TPA: TrkA family potassium uptake protein [Campylobacterales bacterium]|nr:TrkA family potassium uptake protein [Campylobacterales bacterium]
MARFFMANRQAFIFGYSKRSIFITQELQKKSFLLSIIVSNNEAYNRAKEDGYLDIFKLDMTNDDELLGKLNVKENDYLICVMEDSHFNVFLTLSLRALYPKNKIIALSDSFHVTQKLKMAGATKVIDLYQVSANRIYNILHKPIATKLIDNLLSPDNNLSIREIIIPPNSFLDKIMVDDFDFPKYNVLLVGMIDRRLSEKFLFITTGLEHRLDVGDTMVCIGYNDNLDIFEKYISLEEDIDL